MRSLLAFLETTAAAVPLAGFRARLLAALADLIPCEIITYNEIDPASAATPALVEPVDVIAPPLADAFDALRGQHPLINHYVEHGDGRAILFSDVLRAGRLDRLALYADIFRLLSVEHQIAMILPAPKPLIVGLALNRSGGDFTERLRDNGADEAHELVLLNRGDWSFEASDRAAAWLSAVTGEARARAGLAPESIRAWVSARRGQVAIGDLSSLPAELLLPLDDRSMLAIRHLFAGRSEGRDALLLRRRTTTSAPALDRYGLTRREADILTAAAGGLTNRELGERFSISERTVEKHFSHIYEKLGVKTRTAAVSVALRGAAG